MQFKKPDGFNSDTDAVLPHSVILIQSIRNIQWFLTECIIKTGMCAVMSSLIHAGIVSPDLARSPSALTGPCYRKWLLDLRNSHSLIKTSHSSLIDRLLEGYNNARHGTAVGVCVCD